MAKQQAIRANGATNTYVAQLTSQLAVGRKKGTSVRRYSSTAGEKGEEAVAGGADGAKYTNGEECDAEVSRGGRESASTVYEYE